VDVSQSTNFEPIFCAYSSGHNHGAPVGRAASRISASSGSSVLLAAVGQVSERVAPVSLAVAGGGRNEFDDRTAAMAHRQRRSEFNTPRQAVQQATDLRNDAQMKDAGERTPPTL
jgi:hypothetical protein